MEENLLKYFTKNGEPTTETLQPLNIDIGTINCTYMTIPHTMVTNDGNYFIKYGGSTIDGVYNAIEVYSINSIKTGEALYIFDNIQIGGHAVYLADMKQDEDGRFYALGTYSNNGTYEDYLILFNNFVQDGNCVVRKYYSNTTMGFQQLQFLGQIIKQPGEATYYISNQIDTIYSYKIDITSGNKLVQYNYVREGTISSGNFQSILYVIGNNLIYMEARINQENTIIEYNKLIINTKENEGTHTLGLITTKTIASNEYFGNIIIENYTFKSYYYSTINGNTYLYFDLVDLDGNINTINYDEPIDITSGYPSISITGNYYYLSIRNGAYYNKLIGLYNVNQSFIKFMEKDFTSFFTLTKALKQYNLIVIMGISQNSNVSYCLNINSVGYTSQPYYNNNFFIPQYLNLFSNSTDDTSIIFSRDVSNRFLADNQLTTTFNVPNYLLNNSNIQREDVFGQTNLTIQTTNNQYNKNRFESLYFSYIYNLYINDNTNGDNLSNSSGANRLADSIWNRLDYQDSPLAKARITYEDGSQSILNLDIINVSGNSHTFEYEVTGNINKIEYMSSDEETVYATYRCNLTGTNTISQTITIEEG